MSSFDIQNYKSILQEPHRVVLPFPWIEHIPFAFLLVELLKPKTIVELGVHTGNSYNAFCQATKSLKLDSKCFGIDTWEGEEHAGFYEENVFQDLNAHNNEHYKEFSTLLRTTFDEALSQFADGSIELLHIDGLHTYEAVKHDFETWLPKVKNGGVIIFHDTQVRHKDFGVWKLWSEISDKYPSYEFTHCNGLGVILIGTNAEFASFLQVINKDLFLQQLFPFLGEAITVAAELRQELVQNATVLAESKRTIGQLQEEVYFQKLEIKDFEKEIESLHAKAESMRIKNRVKRIFKF